MAENLCDDKEKYWNIDSVIDMLLDNYEHRIGEYAFLDNDTLELNKNN